MGQQTCKKSTKINDNLSEIIGEMKNIQGTKEQMLMTQPQESQGVLTKGEEGSYFPNNRRVPGRQPADSSLGRGTAEAEAWQ